MPGKALAVPGACNVTINGSGTNYGSIQVNGAYTGTMWIAGSVGNFIDITGGASGDIGIGGDLPGTIDIDGALSGQIRVYGSLFGSISLDSMHPTAAAIAIDYDADGWQTGDCWAAGAVHVGTTNYYVNTPDKHIYEITTCKADLNNDGQVNGTDAALFDTALDSGAYNAQFPGLEGSRVFHGDLNCDGQLTSADAGPFQTRVAAGVCEATCDESSHPSGRIVAWGANDGNQLNVPAPNAEFLAVAGATCTVWA